MSEWLAGNMSQLTPKQMMETITVLKLQLGAESSKLWIETWMRAWDMVDEVLFYNVVMTQVGKRVICAIKMVRAHQQMSLRDAKDFVDFVANTGKSKTLVSKVSLNEAGEVLESFRAGGSDAHIEIVPV